MKTLKHIISFILIIALDSKANSYNSFGQTGLINLPSAEVHEEQSIYVTVTRGSFLKLGTITVTPFNWLEASYFYYRPDDLLWGGAKGLYLDKGFNVKLSYKPDSILLPRIALGLDDFAGTGQFTREYIVTTYDFNNLKLTTGLGWGKFVGNSSISNPFTVISDRFRTRQDTSFGLGGEPNFKAMFHGRATPLIGMEIKVPLIDDLTFKVENNPFNYFDFACCGEGLSKESMIARPKESDINYGFSYKYKDYGNIDFTYTKGNTWNISLSIGFSSKKPHRKKDVFKPKLQNNNFNQDKKNEFYYDLLDNLNQNQLFLQSASIEDNTLNVTIDSAEHINPIIYTSRTAYISKKIAEFNEFDFDRIEVGHIIRGSKINSIKYRSSDLDMLDRYPNVVVKKYTEISDSVENEYKNHEFQPRVVYPIFINNIAPDIRTHVGSPEKFLYTGFGIKISSEIQINRNLVIYSSIGRSFADNFDDKLSIPNSALANVRTEIVDYLQESSDRFYLKNLNIEYIRSFNKNLYGKVSFGYLEDMYGGLLGEILYKPFRSNIAIGLEYTNVKKREFDQGFSFQDYKISMPRFNFAYYHPKTNILTKWSYGKYLAGDKGYTLDLSRRMPSGWRAGFFFSQTNVSAKEFGEGSFDKGFYINVPLSIFSKGYSRDIRGFSLRTMTRDGGQQLDIQNRLIDSFYGSTYSDINENWDNYLD